MSGVHHFGRCEARGGLTPSLARPALAPVQQHPHPIMAAYSGERIKVKIWDQIKINILSDTKQYIMDPIWVNEIGVKYPQFHT